VTQAVGLRPKAVNRRPKKVVGLRPRSSAKLAGSKRDSCVDSELVQFSRFGREALPWESHTSVSFQIRLDVQSAQRTLARTKG